MRNGGTFSTATTWAPQAAAQRGISNARSLRLSLGSCLPRVEKPWHGGPAISTSAFGISLIETTDPTRATGPRFRLKLATASFDTSTARTGRKPEAAKPALNSPAPLNMSMWVIIVIMRIDLMRIIDYAREICARDQHLPNENLRCSHNCSAAASCRYNRSLQER